MPKQFTISFAGEDASVQVEMLEQQAPQTCKLVWDNLPATGEARHATYSGSEIFLFLPPDVRTQVVENATSRVIPGDVAYYFQKGGTEYGWPDDVTEIAWFYDRDATPSMPDGPVRLNIFGRMVGDTSKFFAVCRRMRREGAKQVEVRRTREG